MANISPKLFQKGLKTALFTTSTAAIMLTSSGALVVARAVVADNAVLSTGAGLDPVGGPPVAFNDGDTLQYNGVFSVDQADKSPSAVDLNNFAAKLFTVTANINLGAVADVA